ncbi:hypothetical protein EC973_006513 [Apophysomyces ossiformis]|uniref:Uncharacterized protein n=1 Tax=Apophysomyces ossiformis TaxID=679940 RepID=A0A8H7BR35_9FUNG|nr:hypothetical protein EC973_006513 [Apophysomyces ossiformis]
MNEKRDLFNTLDLYRYRADIITSRAPQPYGTIPKRTKKRQTPSPSKRQSVPQPLYPATTSSIFMTLFQTLFPSKKSTAVDPLPRLGFMPRSPQTTDVYTSSLAVTAPVSSPVTFAEDEDVYEDDSSYLSTSSSSSSSCRSNQSSYDVPTVRRRSRGNIMITSALSEILCDHYIQTHAVEDDPTPTTVPLKTFKMFEAAPIEKDEVWFLSEQLETPKEWICVNEEPSKILSDASIPPSENILSEPLHPPARAIRCNSAHLRMIVAEVNMIRANKIVCPLRPRAILPQRSDQFGRRPSPLRQFMTMP